MSLNLETKIVTTTPYSVLNNDDVLFINVAGPSSVVLPASGTDGGKKRSYFIKDFSGNAGVNPITITSSGGKTVDGVSFAILNGGYSHIQVIYDGTNWKIIS
jgi:hypothetical protein